MVRLTVLLFCDVHINIGTTLSILQRPCVICGSRAVQTNRAGMSLTGTACWLCENKISSGSPPVFHECTSYNLIPKHTLFFPLIGVSLSEPHTCQTASPMTYTSIYICIVCHSVNKCLHDLIHWTASILQCVINSINAITFK